MKMMYFFIILMFGIEHKQKHTRHEHGGGEGRWEIERTGQTTRRRRMGKKNENSKWENLVYAKCAA